MEEQQIKVCPKDCRRCNLAQQIFCATSLTFNSYEVMSKIWNRLEEIEQKVDSIKSPESGLISPITSEKVVEVESSVRKREVS